MNRHRQIRTMKNVFLSLICMLSFSFSSCISTVEDVAGQYDFNGPIDFAEWYAEDFANDSLWNKAIKDSIMPLMLELPFDDIAKIGYIIKETPAYKLLVATPVPKNKIMESFKNRSFRERAEFYTEYYSLFPELTPVFRDSVLAYVDKESFDDIAEVGAIIKESPVIKELINRPMDREKVMESFYNRDLVEGVDFYIKYHRLFAQLDSIFNDSILPIAELAPYPILQNVGKKLASKKIHCIGDSILAASRHAYLKDVKDEIFECKMNSIEIYDQVLTSSIELELDSITNENIRKVIDKFSGGFMDYRRLLVVFGRDEAKFKELWLKYVDGEEYTDVFYRHISSMLRDMYQLQSEYYHAFTGKDMQIDPKIIDPMKLEINFPDGEMEHIKEFIKNEGVKGVTDAVLTLPVGSDPRLIALQKIVEAGAFLVDTAISMQEELDSNDKLVAYCQFAILSQIPDDYRENLRKNVITIISQSYDNLYNNIADEI